MVIAFSKAGQAAGQIAGGAGASAPGSPPRRRVIHMGPDTEIARSPAALRAG